jgi:hypothetical protein
LAQEPESSSLQCERKIKMGYTSSHNSFFLLILYYALGGVCAKSWRCSCGVDRHSGSLNAPTTEICNYHWPAALRCVRREDKESGRTDGRLTKLQMCVLKLMRGKKVPCSKADERSSKHIKKFKRASSNCVSILFCVPRAANTPLQLQWNIISKIYDGGYAKKEFSRDILIKLLSRKSNV